MIHKYSTAYICLHKEKNKTSNNNQYASFAAYNYKKKWNLIQKQSSYKKGAALKKDSGIQDGGQEMAIIVG